MITTSTPGVPSDLKVDSILRRLADHTPSVATAADPEQPDPVDEGIAYALCHGGWLIIPNLGFGLVENAIMRHADFHTDLMSIPDMGYFTIARLVDGPKPGRPRQPAYVQWSHQVPPNVAVHWLLTDSDDDQALVEWGRYQRQESG